MYPSISINSKNFQKEVVKRFKSDGLVVINDVLTPEECNQYMDSIVEDFEKICPELKEGDSDINWENFMPQNKPGLFQSLVSNLQAVWDIRSNQNIEKVFKTLYSALRKKDLTDFIVSGDGINIKPNSDPIHTNRSQDWAHLDQTIRNDIFKCIQGMSVLTNTTASFRATPKSHLIFEKLLDNCGVSKEDNSNWFKLSKPGIDLAKEMLKDHYEDGEIKWQIPIRSKRGSFIVWSSSVIHSAKLQDRIEKPSKADKYKGWRGVVYVCYRPKSEFSSAQLRKRVEMFERNRVSNHWGTKIFPKITGSRWSTYQMSKKKSPEIQKILGDPELVYEKVGKPDLTEKQKKLAGYYD